MPFEDYLEQEIFHDNPDAEPNNFILASAINETNGTNDENEIPSQPSRAMYGSSLLTRIETEWIFKDVERPDETLLQQPFFGAFLFYGLNINFEITL
jgi:hypothetical protein